MALLKELYDFTRYVDRVDGTDKVLQFHQYHTEAWEQYAHDTGVSEKKAKIIGRMASDMHYVTYTPLDEHDGPPNKLIVDSAGQELIHKTMFGLMPKGLWLAWADKNSKLINLIWLIIGLVVGNIDTIVKLAQEILPT
jgi:hypothetical protein